MPTISVRTLTVLVSPRAVATGDGAGPQPTLRLRKYGRAPRRRSSDQASISGDSFQTLDQCPESLRRLPFIDRDGLCARRTPHKGDGVAGQAAVLELCVRKQHRVLCLGHVQFAMPDQHVQESEHLGPHPRCSDAPSTTLGSLS